MDIQVLVATMGQTDLSLAEKMNVPCNAVIANQCGQWTMTRDEGNAVQMLSSDTRGVGINRNLALQLATADILLFADDDITYYDGALQGVLDAFEQLPDADMIFFGLDMTKNGEVFEKRRHKIKRLHIWNSLRFGAARMAVRREAVEKKRLSFSKLFGGGCPYSSGEDTIFIIDALHAGLHLYSHSHVLGKCAKDSSSWFSGYDDKYFYDWGAMLCCGFPKMKGLLKWYFAAKLSKKTQVPMDRIIKLMNRGMKGFRHLTPYRKAVSGKENGEH